MKNIRILHLFPKLLSLYGEYGNVVILKKALSDAGYSIDMTEYENEFPETFSEFDFIYVGSGTEDNIIEANRRIFSYRDLIRRSIEEGKYWLATGNSMALFGKVIKRRDEESASSGIFDYTTELFDDKRFSGDVLTSCDNDISSQLVGYVNTSSLYTGVKNPFCEFLLNSSLGNDKKSAFDGIRYMNFYGTQMIGPVLVKNPFFLNKLCKNITDSEEDFTLSSYQYLAYETTLSELKKRLV